MKKLTAKNILVALTGSIACYKSPELVRRLREQGADVRVVMTPNAKAFITPMTLQAVSGHPVHDDLWDTQAEAAMGHIELAKWADQIIIAPASANFIAKLANGLADDLLTTLCLATRATLYVAPAMNQAMWSHPATQRNCQLIENMGIRLLGTNQGEQACGDVGHGRMLEPNEIINRVTAEQILANKTVLITAGPTQEPIDAVRYISNRSSGKMGFALAAAAREFGARVILISGPTALTLIADVEYHQVITAEQMHATTMQYADQADIFIGAAAVSDIKPKNQSAQKVNKADLTREIGIDLNPDIIAEVARLEKKPFVVGFAAQTHDIIAKAKAKMQKKSLDMVVTNQVAGLKGGFECDENSCTAIWNGNSKDFPLTSKIHLAQQLLTLVKQVYEEYQIKNTR
ncbi:MAG: bifunctional phosphopantothenoylcysteine decarboxylase/phosphopantothenate--cysteine ligase CoaBC [Pseudomonadota bacterium]